MNKKLLVQFCFLYICCNAFTSCRSQSLDAIEIVFFDLNDFDRTDTLWITNTDTVNSIKNLFSSMTTADMKFPRRYQITILHKGFSEVYYSNGRYVRSNRKTYVLQDGRDLNLFESILNTNSKEPLHVP